MANAVNSPSAGVPPRLSFRFGAWLGLAALIVVLDQLSKAWILSAFHTGESVRVLPVFDLVLFFNPGASFSFLADAGGWQRWFFTGLALVATVVIVWMLRRHGTQRLFAFALACILGGAVGNVIDRLLHGYVVDFLQFHWRWLAPMFPGGYFPAFNVADAAITVGAFALILDELRRVRAGR